MGKWRHEKRWEKQKKKKNLRPWFGAFVACGKKIVFYDVVGGARRQQSDDDLSRKSLAFCLDIILGWCAETRNGHQSKRDSRWWKSSSSRSKSPKAPPFGRRRCRRWINLATSRHDRRLNSSLSRSSQDYSGFFAQHQLNGSFPGYKVKPNSRKLPPNSAFTKGFRFSLPVHSPHPEHNTSKHNFQTLSVTEAIIQMLNNCINVMLDCLPKKKRFFLSLSLPLSLVWYRLFVFPFFQRVRLPIALSGAGSRSCWRFPQRGAMMITTTEGALWMRHHRVKGFSPPFFSLRLLFRSVILKNCK